MSTFGGQASTVAQNILSIAQADMLGAADIGLSLSAQFKARIDERASRTNPILRSVVPPLPAFVVPDEIASSVAMDAAVDVLERTSQTLLTLDDQLIDSKAKLLAQFDIIDAQIAEEVASQLASGSLTSNPVASARQVSGAEAVHSAALARLRLKRLDDEAALYGRAVASGFYRAPGSTIAAVMAVREKFIEDVGKSATESVLDQKKKNAMLYTDWALQSFELVAGISRQYAKLATTSMELMLELLPDHDKGLDVENPLVAREMSVKREALVTDFNDSVAKVYASYEQLRNKERVLGLDQLFRRLTLDINRNSASFNAELAARSADVASTIGSVGQVASSLGGVAARAISAFNISASITERGFT